LGENAGSQLNGGESNNIDIGANVDGVGGESNTIRIGNTDITDTFISGISGATVPSGAAVLVDSNGHLGTVTSSKRFKEEIKPMNKTSEAIFSLEPVTFRYKKEIDRAGIAHRRNEEQQATIAQLKSGMEALTATVKEQAAQIQKVSAQLEAGKSGSQVVANK
jgi:hypothetical protein